MPYNKARFFVYGTYSRSEPLIEMNRSSHCYLMTAVMVGMKFSADCYRSNVGNKLDLPLPPYYTGNRNNMQIRKQPSVMHTTFQLAGDRFDRQLTFDEARNLAINEPEDFFKYRCIAKFDDDIKQDLIDIFFEKENIEILATNFQQLNVESEQIRLNAAAGVACNKPWLIENIAKFNLGPDAQYELAKYVSQDEWVGESVVNHFEHFAITDQNHLVEIIDILISKSNAYLVAQNFNKFNVANELDRFTRAASLCDEIPNVLCRNINQFNLSPERLLDVASALVSNRPYGFSENIQNFNISDPQRRYELALNILENTEYKDPNIHIQSLAEHIDKYDLDEQQRLDIANKIAEIDPIYVSENIEKFLPLPDTEQKKLLCCKAYVKSLETNHYGTDKIIDRFFPGKYKDPETRFHEFSKECSRGLLTKLAEDINNRKNLTQQVKDSLLKWVDNLELKLKLSLIKDEDLTEVINKINSISRYPSPKLREALTRILFSDCANSVEKLKCFENFCAGFRKTHEVKPTKSKKSKDGQEKAGLPEDRLLAEIPLFSIIYDEMSSSIKDGSELIITLALANEMKNGDSLSKYLQAVCALRDTDKIDVNDKFGLLVNSIEKHSDLNIKNSTRKNCSSLKNLETLLLLSKNKELSNKLKNELQKIKSPKDLDNLLQQKFKEVFSLESVTQDKVEKFFINRKEPYTLFNYAVSHGNNPTMKEAIKAYAQAAIVGEEAFKALRYDIEKSDHLKKIHEFTNEHFLNKGDFLDQWKNGIEKVIFIDGKECTVTLSDNSEDLFLYGEYIHYNGSCQMASGGMNNQALMGAALDGKYRVVTIHQNPKGEKPMVARCLVRLVWDDETNRPAIHPESSRTISGIFDEYKEVMMSVIQQKADALHCDIVLTDEGDIQRYCDQKNKKVAKVSFAPTQAAPYEYIDGMLEGRTELHESHKPFSYSAIYKEMPKWRLVPTTKEFGRPTLNSLLAN